MMNMETSDYFRNRLSDQNSTFSQKIKNIESGRGRIKIKKPKSDTSRCGNRDSLEDAVRTAGETH